MGSVVFSSSYSVSGYSYATCNVRVGYSENYNASTNTTTLAITSVEIQREGNGTNWGSIPVFGSIRVNGSTLLSVSGGSSYRVSLSGSGYCAANIPSSSSAVIVHNDDGSKSVSFELVGGVSKEGSSFFCGYYNSQYPIGAKSQSKTVALTSHPRASNISSCSSGVETQGCFSLSVARNSSAFWHKATIKIGGATMYTSGAFATSMTCTIPRSWFSSYPSAASLTATVSVQTYSGSACTAAVGSAVTRSFTVTADAGMKPTVSAGWVSLSAHNTGAIENIFGFVKGYSQAEAAFDSDHIDMSDAVGASIASYSVTCQGTTASASPYRTPVLTQSSLVCTVTDTRGRSASETFTVVLMDYAAPTLTGVSVFRCDANGAPDEDGTYYAAKASLTYSSLNTQNTCSLAAAHKAAGGSYGTATNLTSGAASIIGPVSADLSYTVKISAADALGNTAEFYATIATRKWAMHFRPNGSGVAFGKAAETDNTFEIDDGLAVKSKGIVDLIYPVGSIYMSVNAASPATLFGGTWAAIEDRFLLAAGSTYTAGDTGGEAEHTLSVTEMPKHRHSVPYQSGSTLGSTYARLPLFNGTATGNVQAAEAGGGGAHNNMPPYLAVHMWKRTA